MLVRPHCLSEAHEDHPERQATRADASEFSSAVSPPSASASHMLAQHIAGHLAGAETSMAQSYAVGVLRDHPGWPTGAPRFFFVSDAAGVVAEAVVSPESRFCLLVANLFWRTSFRSSFNWSSSRCSRSFSTTSRSLRARSASIAACNARRDCSSAFASNTSVPNATPPKCGQWLTCGHLCSCLG